MSEEEKLEWYECFYKVLHDAMDEDQEILFEPISFYFCDDIYNSMDYQTKKECKR